MIQGQLFRLKFVGRQRLEAHTVVSEQDVLLVAANGDDALSRFPYVFDLSDFDDYGVLSVEKEPERCVVTSSTTRLVPHTHPDAVVQRGQRNEGQRSQVVWQPVAQEESGHKYMVAVSAVLYAKSESHATKKLTKRIIQSDPRVTNFCEEIHIADGVAKPRDVSVFERASIIGLKS